MYKVLILGPKVILSTLGYLDPHDIATPLKSYRWSCKVDCPLAQVVKDKVTQLKLSAEVHKVFLRVHVQNKTWLCNRSQVLYYSYYTDDGFWDLIPSYSGTWTFSDCVAVCHVWIRLPVDTKLVDCMHTYL